MVRQSFIVQQTRLTQRGPLMHAIYDIIDFYRTNIKVDNGETFFIKSILF